MSGLYLLPERDSQICRNSHPTCNNWVVNSFQWTVTKGAPTNRCTVSQWLVAGKVGGLLSSLWKKQQQKNKNNSSTATTTTTTTTTAAAAAATATATATATASTSTSTSTSTSSSSSSSSNNNNNSSSSNNINNLMVKDTSIQRIASSRHPSIGGCFFAPVVPKYSWHIIHDKFFPCFCGYPNHD